MHLEHSSLRAMECRVYPTTRRCAQFISFLIRYTYILIPFLTIRATAIPQYARPNSCL